MIVNIENNDIAESKSLIAILRSKGIYINQPCGGDGRCGKCAVRIVTGELPVTARDEELFDRRQLEAGYRIACLAYVLGACSIEVPDIYCEKDFYVSDVADVSDMPEVSNMPEIYDEPNVGGAALRRGELGIAIDIGTTTIAMVLFDICNGDIVGSYTGVNHQRGYGADVMARIKAAVDGSAKTLQNIVRKDIFDGLSELFCRIDKSYYKSIKEIALAGNTTMLHLLRGYDVSQLGNYPFTPVKLEFERIDLIQLVGESYSEELIKLMENMGCMQPEVIILPGISAFVGADIVAGLYSCDALASKSPKLFLDLGTNAEMALYCNGDIIVTSAAAGPAFEGGGISCGVGSILGAIRDIRIQYGLSRYETIGRRSPVGICGTGIVAGISELRKNKLIDENGTLRARYIQTGYPVVDGSIYITQSDIREFQKAKAAIRAGLELLVAKGGYSISEVEQLQAAGGFGCQLDVKKAVGTGLIPVGLAGRTVSGGNTVIRGLVKYMQDDDALRDRKLIEIIESAEEFSLAEHRDFYEKFMEYMSFS